MSFYVILCHFTPIDAIQHCHSTLQHPLKTRKIRLGKSHPSDRKCPAHYLHRQPWWHTAAVHLGLVPGSSCCGKPMAFPVQNDPHMVGFREFSTSILAYWMVIMDNFFVLLKPCNSWWMNLVHWGTVTDIVVDLGMTVLVNTIGKQLSVTWLWCVAQAAGLAVCFGTMCLHGFFSIRSSSQPTWEPGVRLQQTLQFSGNRAGLQIRPMIKFEPDAMCLQINARYRALYDVVGNIKYMLSRLLEELAPKSGTSPGAKWVDWRMLVWLD